MHLCAVVAFLVCFCLFVSVEKSSSSGLGSFLLFPNIPELGNEFFLLLAQILWNIHLDRNVVISALVRVAQSWGTIALQSHDLSRLCSGRNLDGHLTVDNGRLDGVSENRVQITNSLFGIDFGSLATEIAVLLDAQENVQVTGRSTVGAGVSLPSHAKLVSVFDSRGNRDLDLLCLLVESLSTAGSTVFLDLLSGTSAAGAGLLRLEVTEWRSGDLDRDSLTATLGTGDDLGSGLDSVSVAGFAGFQVSDSYLFFSTKDGRLEVNLQIESKIVARDGSTRLSSTTASETSAAAHAASHAAAKEGIKDVIQVDLLSETGTASKGGSLSLAGGRCSNSLFTKHVVFLFQLGVLEDLVGTVDLLEFFGSVLSGVGVCRIIEKMCESRIQSS